MRPSPRLETSWSTTLGPPAPPTAAASAPEQTDESQRPHRKDQRLARRLLAETRGYRLRLMLITALELLSMPLALLSPVPLALAVDSVVGQRPVPGFLDAVLPGAITGNRFALLAAAAAMQLVVTVAVQLQFLASYTFQTRVAEGLTLAFRSRLFSHIQRLSFSFHDRRGSADSMYRVDRDSRALQDFAVYGIIPMVSSVAVLVGMAVVTFRINALLAMIGLAIAPLLYWLQRQYKRRMRARYTDVSELESEALQRMQESLAAGRVVKAFGREAYEHDRFMGTAARGARARVRLALAEGLLGLTTQTVIALGTAAVLYVGVTRVLAGDLTVGSLLLVFSYLGRLNAPLASLSKRAGTLQGALARAQRCFELLDVQPDVRDRPGARALGRARGAIEFRDVTFTYDDGSPVLRGADLRIPAGSRVGIAGVTGAGKSTMLGLLTRFYDPTEGEIRLDGVDLRDYRLADLRNQFSIVLQEPVLFSTSIAENIAYGRPGATMEEIVEAAGVAGAHDFITRLSDGYDTLVGERGMRMSGGERQRISLARAFLKDAPILLLDEPTSSVDVQTESAIIAAMQRLMEGRTTFMVAHRLSTLAICDVILRVDDQTISMSTDAPADDGHADDRAVEPAHVAAQPRTGRLRRITRRFAAQDPPAASPPAPTGGDDWPLRLRSEDEGSTGGGAGAPRHVLDALGYDTQSFEILTRRPDAHATQRKAEIILCKVGSSQLALRCVLAATAGGRRTEPYVLHVHQRLLAQAELPHPRLLGTFRDAEGEWLVFDHAQESWRVSELATAEAMGDAARWLADFHRTFEAHAAGASDIRVLHRDHYLAAAGAVAAARHAPDSTRAIAESFAKHVDELLNGPLTVIVGESSPANFISVDGRAHPADFDATALACGELDLASLVEGWPSDIVDQCCDVYVQRRWAGAAPAEFARRLDLGLVLMHLRTIGQSASIPQWRHQDLLHCARRLGFTS